MLGILFAASALGAPRLLLTGPAAVGTVATFAFSEDVAGSVLVPGCAPLELERRDGKVWVPFAPPLCDRSAPATTLDGETALTVTVPAAGTWRAVLTWGSDCVAGRPFSLAACRRVEVARSEPFEAP
jgi:hypothetical protein